MKPTKPVNPLPPKLSKKKQAYLDQHKDDDPEPKKKKGK